MPVMHFDTHKFVRRLRDAGISESQAEALSDALGEVQSEANLVTRQDLQIALAPLYRDLVLIKWMMGVLLGGVATLILKSFFPT